MNSSRLPGKAMMKILGKPMLWHTIKRSRDSKLIKNVIVATTIEKDDEAIYQYCKTNDIKCFRGSEDDVLDRFYQCAKENNADCIVRMCADVPYLKEWQIIQQIENFKKYKIFTYGNGAWVCSFSELEESWFNGKHPEVREHVNDRMFRAIDYPDDLERLRKMNEKN